jgi:predicted RecA/RadA family phage recombinase
MAGSNYVDVNAKKTYGPHEAGTHVTISTTDATLITALSGNLVVAGQLVGIAVADYDSDTHLLTLDTMGCYELSVDGKDTGGSNVAITIGSTTTRLPRPPTVTMSTASASAAPWRR